MAEDEAVAVATPVTPFERRSTGQGSLLDRLERCREDVRGVTERLIGPRPRPTNVEQKKLATSIDLLEREIAGLKEGL